MRVLVTCIFKIDLINSNRHRFLDAQMQLTPYSQLLGRGGGGIQTPFKLLCMSSLPARILLQVLKGSDKNSRENAEIMFSPL